jgi:hypothetical protein
MRTHGSGLTFARAAQLSSGHVPSAVVARSRKLPHVVKAGVATAPRVGEGVGLELVHPASSRAATITAKRGTFRMLAAATAEVNKAAVTGTSRFWKAYSVG